MFIMKTLALAAAALTSLAAAKKPTATTTPCTTTTPPTSSCTSTICADYVNDCGKTFGGCYPACLGFTTPSFTDPGCPTTTSSSAITASASCTQTICADYIDACNQWYGGCYPACSGYPTPSFSTPYCSIMTSSTKTKTKKACHKTKCVDYVNDCGQTYGGCFKACRGHKTPNFTDPGCPATTADPSGDCAFVCSDFFDECGNTFGPGCYTSCPGVPMPTYTTPVCNTEAGTHTTAA